jgi:hypothetical protein
MNPENRGTKGGSGIISNCKSIEQAVSRLANIESKNSLFEILIILIKK